MDVTPLLSSDVLPIDGYGVGFFRIHGERVEGAVFITPTRFISAPVSAVEAVTSELITQLCQQEPKPEVFLLGMGTQMASLPPKAWRGAAQAEGVMLEAMTTGAACRTWNVLLAEGRRVVALLLPVE